MTTQAFCGTCGAERPAGAAFCARCGTSFAVQPTIQQGLAGGLVEIEKMRAKLIVGRLLGIAVAMAVWWFVIGPAFADQPLVIIVAFFVAAFAGLYVGQMAVLMQQRR